MKTEIAENGFAVIEDVVSKETVTDLLNALDWIAENGSIPRRGGIFAVRNLLDVSPEVEQVANSPVVRALIEPILGPKLIPVRGILSVRAACERKTYLAFDKPLQSISASSKRVEFY